MHISDILHRKGHEIKSAAPDTPLEHCAAMMKLDRIGALVVCDAEKNLKGIISERDVVHAVVDHGPRGLKMRAEEAMDVHPATCAPGDTVAAVAKKMTDGRKRHVPVCEDGKIVGLVSIGDIVRERLDEMELERNTLRDLAGAHLSAV